MPVIAVTRLRLRDPALPTEFFTAGAAVLRQAKKAEATSARMCWPTLTTRNDERPHLR